MLFHPAHGYYGTGDWLWSVFSTALFIGLFVVAITLLVRVFSGPRRPGAGPVGGPRWYGPSSGSEPGVRPGSAGTGPAWRSPEAEGAERILAERYARGEISEEEYQGRLEVLRRSAPGWAMQQQGPYPPQQSASPQPQAQPQPEAQQPVQASAGPEGQQRTEEVR